MEKGLPSLREEISSRSPGRGWEKTFVLTSAGGVKTGDFLSRGRIVPKEGREEDRKGG